MARFVLFFAALLAMVPMGCADRAPSTPPAGGADAPAPAPDAAPAPPPAPARAEAPPLEIVGTYPLAGEALTGRLVVYFNQELQPLPGAVSLEPAEEIVETRSGATHVELRFDPAKLRPGKHTLKLDSNLKSAAGSPLAAPSAPITFEVPNTQPPVATAMRRVDADDALLLEVAFNRAMTVDSLLRTVKVTDAGGQQVQPAFEPAEDHRTLALRLPPSVALPLQVRVEAGAEAEEGGIRSAVAQTFDYPSSTLSVYSVGLADATSDERIALRWNMSGEVSLDAVRESLRATDANGAGVGAEVRDAGARDAFIATIPASAAAPVTLSLAAGLRADDGAAVLIEPHETRYPSGALEIQDVAWQRDEGNNQLRIAFSEPVHWGVVPRFVSVTDADSGQTCNLEPSELESEENTLYLYDVPAEATQLKVTFAPGLRGLNLGVLAAAETRELYSEAPDFAVDSHWWQSRGEQGLSLYLRLNQRVDIVSLREALYFGPGVSNIAVRHSYGSSYSVTGDFAPETDYTLYLSTKLKSPTGMALLRENYELPLERTPEAEPGAGFDFDDKFYFPRRNKGIVPLIARNVDKVDISVAQLFPNNIAAAIMELEDGRTWGDFEGDWAKSLNNKTIPVNGAGGKSVKLPLDMNDVLPADARGVFGVTLTPQPYNYATKIVLWTDIGLLAHWLDDALVVFAHDLTTIAPIAGAKVTVYSQKNQVLGEATTDTRGVAEFRAFDRTLGTPEVAVCETPGDYTFLKLTARSDDALPVTDAMPRYDKAAYDAYLYADRNLYRPGETVHARWIARTNYGDALPNVPLQLVVTNPQGAELRREAVTLSALGTGGIDLATDRQWPTGKYTISLGVPDAAPSGTLQVSIEDFVPNRLKTEVSAAPGPWRAQTEYAITVRAEQLFGGPAANQKAKASVILRKGEWKPEQWQGYRFSNDVDFPPDVVPLGEATTNAEGVATFRYTFAGSRRTSFPIQAVVRGEVAEAGARAVADTKEVLLLPAEPLLGVSLAGNAGNGVQVEVAAVNADASPAAAGAVNVILEREDWSYYVRRFADHNEPSFTRSFVKIDERTVALTDGRGAAVFDLGEYSWGYHRVRVESADTSMQASQSFYKMWNGIEVADSPRPSLIKLALNKPAYSPGETAELRIESPFDGQAFVVVQGEDFKQVHTTAISGSAGVLTIPVDAAMYPNVWVGVTVVHAAPADRRQVYPYSSFAMVNLPVPDPARRIDVTLPDVPTEIRPATELTLTVETRGADGQPRAAEVTVAAVDEGIHGILDYADPDPWNHLQRPRQLDHRRAHYYDRVAYDFDPAAIGGDLATRLARRSATIGENWIKPVALWSGAVQTDASGRATVSFAVPEFNGQLRIVAVAADTSATGAASRQLYVRRPYMLQTSMPRFVLPGDTFKARGTIFNTTQQPVNATVSWTPEGALVNTPGNATITTPASGNIGTLAPIAAGSQAGQGQITWRLDIEEAPDESVSVTSPIPVRPPAAYQSRHQLAVLQRGETQTFATEAFIEDENTELAVTVGADPALRVFNALRYLVQYPYGCVEQTTSACFPLYLLRKSAGLMQETLPEARRAEVYLKHGIDRLAAMQTASGGLAYWPGGREPHAYGSVYALHFLTLVHNDHELEMPGTAFQQLQDYVRRLSTDSSDKSESGMYLRAYACYVLALGGDQSTLEQLGRYDNITLPEPARYLLAAALAVQTADAARVEEYLRTAPTTPYTRFERAGTLNTPLRAQAVKLMALVQMKAPEDAIAPLVQQIAAHLDRPYYTNTQETAFAAAALGSYFNRLSENIDAARGRVSGPEGAREFLGRDVFTLRHTGPGGRFEVANTGQTSVYVNVVSSGIPVEAVAEAASEGGMVLSRRITALDGTPVENGQYRQGESYLVALELQGQAGLEHVVIADLLPAGFEVENPRLDANVMAAAMVTNNATPSYLDIRDDRVIIAFDTLPSEQTNYYYVVRAVTPGSYTHPASTAECMYDPAFRAATAPATAEVVE